LISGSRHGQPVQVARSRDPLMLNQHRHPNAM
jgi:hypothetical protein